MPHAVDVPLCIDMDGTLLRIDTLHESALAAVTSDWRMLLRIPLWLAAGKARLKAALAAHWQFDAALLPASPALLHLLAAERAHGRRLVLCTAADRRIAEAVAAVHGPFEAVIASDGTANLRGPAKAAALVARFGPAGFDYAGNDATDHPVWDAAREAILVNAPSGVVKAARRRHRVAAVLDDGAAPAAALLRALRPHQWLKNLLCLVPPIAAGVLDDGRVWSATLLCLAAFCLVASSIYLLNDLLDLAADRAHPAKRRRPLAAGALPALAALVAMPALLVVGFVLGWLSGALPTLAVYAALNLAYNLRLKGLPLADVFSLAALYVLRLFGGGEASGHPVSLWLLGFATFIFLSLALAKRVSELQLMLTAGRAGAPRRGYLVQDLAVLQGFGVAASFSSSIVLALYVQSDTALRSYPSAWLLWGNVPLLLFWQCRMWLATARGWMHDDPIIYAARDWVAWWVLAGVVALGIAARLPHAANLVPWAG